MKKFSLIFIVFFLFSSFAYAQELNEIENDLGAPTFDYYFSKLSAFQQFVYNLGHLPAQTVVNGAQCNQNADDQATGIPKLSDGSDAGSLCLTNNDHIGVAWQIFQVNPWKTVAEIAIPKGTKQCVTLPVKGVEYYRQWFYCDDNSKTCTKEVSVCNTNEGVLRERTCVYPDGRSVLEKVVDTNWKDSSVAVCQSGADFGVPKIGDGSASVGVGSPVPSETISTDFKLFNLFRIDGLSKEQWEELDVPFLARLDSQSPSIEVYRFSIKNTGNKASAVTIESFLVAQSNPFSATVTQGLNLIPLQATYGRAGITEQKLTCKGEAGKRFLITEMQQNEERTYYFSLAVPRQGDVLAGNPNYDINGHYILILNAISGCTGDIAFYDIIGGSRNFAVKSDGSIDSSGGGGSVPVLPSNESQIDPEARQVGIDLTDVSKKTTKDLAQSLCTGDSMCEDDSECRPMAYLIDKGQLTGSEAENKIKGHVDDITAAAGIAVGALTAPLICKVLGKTLGKATISTKVISIPVCTAITSVTGAYIGYKLAKIGSETEELFDALNEEDTSKVGYCINQPEEGGSGFSLSGIRDAIGKALNDLFGGQAKTKASNSTIGLIALSIIGILIVLRLTSKR